MHHVGGRSTSASHFRMLHKKWTRSAPVGLVFLCLLMVVIIPPFCIPSIHSSQLHLLFFFFSNMQGQAQSASKERKAFWFIVKGIGWVRGWRLWTMKVEFLRMIQDKNGHFLSGGRKWGRRGCFFGAGAGPGEAEKMRDWPVRVLDVSADVEGDGPEKHSLLAKEKQNTQKEGQTQGILLK